MATGQSGPTEKELAAFRLSIEGVLDAALELRWKLGQGPDAEERAELQRQVVELNRRVGRWRTQLAAEPALEAAAGERLRHVGNILAECAGILDTGAERR
jgi:hypothetical protein